MRLGKVQAPHGVVWEAVTPLVNFIIGVCIVSPELSTQGFSSLPPPTLAFHKPGSPFPECGSLSVLLSVLKLLLALQVLSSAY